MERTILATIDESTLSETVLQYLPAIVRPNDLIVLLTVLEYPAARRRTVTGYELPVVVGTSVLGRPEPTTPAYAEDKEQAIARSRAEAQEDLYERSLLLRNEGLSVNPHVLFDENAAHGIIAYARELGPLFIAMATHGRGGLDHAIHGSVVEQVIRSGVAPVLVVRP